VNDDSRPIAVSLSCTNWDSPDRLASDDEGKLRCPHCHGLMIAIYKNEQDFFNESDFKKNKADYLFTLGKCFSDIAEIRKERRKKSFLSFYVHLRLVN